MNMTKDFLSGKIDDIEYTLDFPYQLDKIYKKCINNNIIIVSLYMNLFIKKELPFIMNYQMLNLRNLLENSVTT